MTIFRTIHNKNYTTINNAIIKDSRISWKAKGIWLYAFSRPDDWTFILQDIINQSTDGKDSVTAGLKELENFGYLLRLRSRDSEGRLLPGAEWQFYEISQLTEGCEPKTENTIQAKPYLADPPLLSTDVLPSTKEQQQQPCVVVSPNSQSFELLKAQGFDDKTATSLAKFHSNRILRQIQHLKIAQQEAHIANPIGWLRNAIESDWNPPEKKVDPAEEAAELRSKQLVERTAVKKQCEDIFDEHESKFTTKKYFILGDDVLTMRSGDKNFGIPYDNGTIKTLERFIHIEF